MSESSIEPVADEAAEDAEADAAADELLADAAASDEAEVVFIDSDAALNDEAVAEADEGSEPSLPEVIDEHNMVAISVEDAVRIARAGGATEDDIRDLIYNAQSQQPSTSSSEKRSLDEVAEAASEAAQEEVDALAGSDLDDEHGLDEDDGA